MVPTLTRLTKTLRSPTASTTSRQGPLHIAVSALLLFLCPWLFDLCNFFVFCFVFCVSERRPNPDKHLYYAKEPIFASSLNMRPEVAGDGSVMVDPTVGGTHPTDLGA